MIDWESAEESRTGLGTVRVGISTQTEKALFRHALAYGILLSLVALACILLMQLQQMRRVLAPLKHLTDVTRKLAQGDLKRRAFVVRLGEVRDVLNLVNGTDRSRDSQPRIQLKVEQRPCLGRGLWSCRPSGQAQHRKESNEF